MIIVGLDVATHTGWCRWSDGDVRTGVLDLSPGSKDEPEGVRFHRFGQRLPDVVDGADLVVIEQTYSRGRRTAEVLHGLIAVALVVCESRRLPYAFVDASTLKKHATGNGAAKKADMIAAAQDALGRSGLTDDEADAYHLVAYALEKWTAEESAA